MRAGKWLTTGFAAVMASAVAVPTSADQYTPPPLDVQLLSADAILFGTVVRLEPNSSANVVEVSLSDVSLLASRWDSPKLWKFRVQGEVSERDGVESVRIPHRMTLVAGTRYLLLLRGGEVSFAPFEAWGGYEVRSSGEMLCTGGEIYAVTPLGLLCSRQSDQVGAPLTEDRLASILVTSLAHARERRPAFAQERDRSVQPLGAGLVVQGGGR
jgi:hypothetical protein